jgi:tetratricopeptide (TPR) repeat protein
MKTSLIAFFCFLGFYGNLNAATEIKSLANSPKQKSAAVKKHHKGKLVRKEMSTISGHIRQMGLFIASEQEFIRDSNKPIIEKHLEELTALFKNLKIHPVIETQGLSLNQNIMTDQLEQTLLLFKKDKRALARAKFNAALNLCVSCHTQSPGVVHPKIDSNEKKIFADKDISKLKITNFEKAELYFITRDFEAAMKLYDKVIRSSKKTDDDEFIYKALERQLIYFVKIKKTFPEAKTHFDNYLKEHLLNAKVAQEVSEWVAILSGKGLWEGFDPAKVKEEDMEKFMKTFIADDEEGPIFSLTNSSEVNDLNLSSILMDYYNAHPDTKLGAKILYWMATLDKRVNDELFFSLGDYYLIGCMEKYPKDPIAKDCYETYLEDLEINYLGKEKEFPPEIKARVKRLQKLIEYNDSED